MLLVHVAEKYGRRSETKGGLMISSSVSYFPMFSATLNISLCYCVCQELVLYPNNNGCVEDLMQEARKHVQLEDTGSGKLR